MTGDRMHRRGFRGTLRSGLGLLLALAMLFAALPAGADGAVIRGRYRFTSSDLSHTWTEDEFVWRDDCFTRSSFLGCGHLLVLSAQTAMASTGRSTTPDPADDDEIIRGMLADMGFLDVETNAWYTAETRENSVGVAVGHKEIEADGRVFTLLAVIPRSAGYRQEWAGNLSVGSGSIHRGFLEARDEVLRFLRQYILDHGVSGSVKVWLAGHSRGGAVANLTAGFLAGGGSAWLPGVSVAPEDIYCYTFASPCTIRDGALVAEALSVSGARDGLYAQDTPGRAWVNVRPGTVDPDDAVYGGIRNYRLSYDAFPMLPPERWGYTRYGTSLALNECEGVTADAMLRELEALSPVIFGIFNERGDYRRFSVKSVDLPGLALADDPGAGPATVEEMLLERVSAMILDAPSPADYEAGGLQETLAALAGLYGLLSGGQMAVEDVRPLILPGALALLAFTIERMEAEGRIDPGAPEHEKAARAAAEYLSFLLGETVDPDEWTVDRLLIALIDYMSEREDSAMTQTLLGAVGGWMTGGSVAAVAGTLLSPYVSDPDATPEQMTMAVLRAAAHGAEPGTPAADDPTLASAENLRSVLYMAMAFAGFMPWSVNGTTTLTALAEAVLPDLLTARDADGKVLAVYPTVSEAADAAFADVPRQFAALFADETGDRSEDCRNAVERHLDTLTRNAGTLRRLLSRILFLTEGEPFSAEGAVRTAATLIGNAGIIPPAHYNEAYIAWARAAAAAMPQEHGEGPVR